MEVQPQKVLLGLAVLELGKRAVLELGERAVLVLGEQVVMKVPPFSFW